MSTESRNVELLKRAYASWDKNKGSSADRFIALFGEAVDFRSLGGGSSGMEFTTGCCSQADLARYFAGLAEDWSMNFYRIDEYVAQGDRVVAIGECSWTHKRTGKTVVTPKVDLWRFKDGKAISFFEMFDTAKAVAATR